MPLPLNLSGLGNQANALVRNAQSQFAASVSSIGKNLKNTDLNKLPAFIASERSNGLVFPLGLRGDSNPNLIEFTAFEKGGKEPGTTQHHIWFPCPANIAINDSATYNTIDLGTIGGALGNAVQSGGGLQGMAERITGQAKGATQSFTGAEIAGAAAQMLPAPDAIKGAAKLASRTLLNPNTNTTFSGNAIRSFTFAFKMIAHSPEEAETIRQIHSKFRSFTYADSRSNAQNLILAFPPTWTIRFLDGQGNENKFIPKIYSCYLVSVESSFNSTTNMFHSDGAPFEVDITISYQETRTLTRTDIDELEADAIGADRGIDPETGAPKLGGGANATAILDTANEESLKGEES